MRSSYVPHERLQMFPMGPSRTKQSFVEESNINTIMAKYEKTGLIEHQNKYGEGRYTDMPNEADFHEAMSLVAEANSMFADLPAGIRRRFDNDPGEFLEFVDDDANRDEMREMGLLGPETAPEPDPAKPAGDPPTDPPTPPEAAVAE